MNGFWNENNPDFTCRHCRNFVSAARVLAGVGHRNHCPYCLWSRCHYKPVQKPWSQFA